MNGAKWKLTVKMFGIDRSIPTKRNVPAFQYFYNITTPVGVGQPNDRSSVLLTQYMLNVFLSRYGSLVDLPPLSLTGLADPETSRAIRAFQWWLRMSPHAGAVPETGILAPVRGPLVEGPRGSYVPTLLLLNRVWAATQPDTFTGPYLLGDALGEEVAETLWAAHPRRTTRFEYAAVEAFL